MFRFLRRFVDPEAASGPTRSPVSTLPSWAEDANTSSQVGTSTTETDVGRIVDTAAGAAGLDTYAGVVPTPGGWTSFAQTPFGGTQVSTQGGTTSVETSAEVEGLFEVHARTAVGREQVNDRFNSDSNNLAYTLTDLLGVDQIDVVGMKDKLSLGAGWSDQLDAPIGVAHDESSSVGHDVYHFQAASGALDDAEREQALAAELGQVDDVTSLDLAAIDAMAPGEGFAFVDESSVASETAVTGRRSFGALNAALTVGFGGGDSDVTQTAVAKLDEDTVRISLMTGDGDRVSSSLGLSVGRDAAGPTEVGGFDVPFAVGAQVDTLGSTEVQMDIDLSTDEGRAQFQRFTQTGLLPGADRVRTTDEGYGADLARYQALEQELAGMHPGSEAYFEKQAEVYAASSELNGAFMQRSTFLEADANAPDGVTYQKWRTQTDQTVTTSAELFAWKMSQVASVERSWDEYARQGNQFDYEAGYFEDSVYTAGDALVVASPNGADHIALGTSSRADLDWVRQLYEGGAIPDSALDPLTVAALQGEIDDFDSGGAQVTAALTRENLAVLGGHADTAELLQGWTRDHTNHQAFEMERILGDMFGEVAEEGGAQGRYSAEDLEEMMAWFGTDPSAPNVQEMHQAMLATTPEEFAEMPPAARQYLIECRATDLLAMGRNPFETLSLVQRVEDPEERTHLLRELFQRVESMPVSMEDGRLVYNPVALMGDVANAGTALLLQYMGEVASELDDPRQISSLMSGVRVDVVDARAEDWAQSRFLEPAAAGQSQEAVVAGVIDDHVSWCLEKQDWDQLSDNFQAAQLAGGPQMVTAVADAMGDDLRGALEQVAAEDPTRLLVFERALAGTPYAGLVAEVRSGS